MKQYAFILSCWECAKLNAISNKPHYRYTLKVLSRKSSSYKEHIINKNLWISKMINISNQFFPNNDCLSDLERFSRRSQIIIRTQCYSSFYVKIFSFILTSNDVIMTTPTLSSLRSGICKRQKRGVALRARFCLLPLMLILQINFS